MTATAIDSKASIAPGALRETPSFRIAHFLPESSATELRRELRDGLEYERVELGSMTRQWRAARPVGDGYFGSMLRRPGWTSTPAAQAGLAYFDSPGFVGWLSSVAGEELRFLRPVTAYRLDRGDKICLHDDLSDPDHAVSVAYNLSTDWRPEYGGATIFGDVVSVTPADTPWDCPIQLQHWEIANERRFVPEFNSLLIMRLGTGFAHGVEEVTGDIPRFSVIGIYGRARSASLARPIFTGGSVVSKFALADNVVCRKTGSDLRMLFDRDKGVMYEMNETASAIIDLITKEPASTDDLADALSESFDGPPDEIRADVERLLADFTDAGLVSQAEQP